MTASDPGLLAGILFNVLIALVPPAVIAVVALVRARRAAAPGLVRTSAVLFLCAGLFGAVFQVLWVVLPGGVPDPMAVLPVLGLVQGVLIGLLTTGALLFLVLALWRARTAAHPVPARGGYGGDGGYAHWGADPVAPAHHGGGHGHRDDPGNRPAPEGPPAHGQPGDPGAAPSHGPSGSYSSSGSSGGGFWGGLFSGGDSSGGGWGGGDSGGGGGDGGGGGGGD
ncbi:hypothetical protein [Nocardiopsis sp. CC223A]|uniref:hypothetical protein n=1 Tax=Nocardiopsis sp. CC223A TaxID=3044051 RepID=UPI00278C6FA7|nr:hypothetical protein [Nocardiopsis sp. CC223A]